MNLLLSAALWIPKQNVDAWIELIEDLRKTAEILSITALPLLVVWILIRKLSRKLTAAQEQAIFADLWKRALEESARMDRIAVPKMDPRRIFPVTLQELRVCKRRGFSRLAGLDLEITE